MARRIVALILGMTVLGLFISFWYLSKDAAVEVSKVDDSAAASAALPIRITAHSNGEIRVDGRSVDPAELEDEIRRIVSGSEEASLPLPTFSIVAERDVDNAVLVMILEALSGAGVRNVSIEPDVAD